jgi:hypothetical protein
VLGHPLLVVDIVSWFASTMLLARPPSPPPPPPPLARARERQKVGWGSEPWNCKLNGFEGAYAKAPFAVSFCSINTAYS